ncbi:MAG: serine hydrolase [Pseudomonadota bacterium]
MLALTCAALPAFAADVPENVDALLQRYHELGQFNGAALVVDGGAIALQKGYGKASLRWSIDNSPSTRFLVGSITKSITALLVLRLADAERLNLDANVSEYLDYYRRDVGERITLRHLLTHTDGLPNYTANGQFWQPDVLAAPLTTRDFITQFCSGDLAFEPGSDYRYGNAGYSILGAIVETVTGETYADAARRLILEPLGMHRTGVHVPGAMIPELAGGYERAPGGLRPAAPIPRPLFAAGSLYSTLDDLLAYDRGLRKGHALEDSVLDAALFTRADAIDGTFAYGWNVGALDLNRAIPSTRYTATNGEINGYNAIMVRIPDAEQLIVLLNNTGETLLFDIVSNILRVLNDLPAVDPEPTLRDAFVSRLDEQTVTAAVTYYRQQRGLLPNDALFFPWTMRITAGHLIADGRYADAAVLLKLNLETNTNDARSLDLLATAQMRSGQPKAAEESLQAALAIEPGNPWFAERLARLRADNPD